MGGGYLFIIIALYLSTSFILSFSLFTLIKKFKLFYAVIYSFVTSATLTFLFYKLEWISGFWWLVGVSIIAFSYSSFLRIEKQANNLVINYIIYLLFGVTFFVALTIISTFIIRFFYFYFAQVY